MFFLPYFEFFLFYFGIFSYEQRHEETEVHERKRRVCARELESVRAGHDPETKTRCKLAVRVGLG